MGQLSFIWRYVVVMFVSLVFWEAKGTVQISTDVNNVFLSWIIYSLNMNGSNIYQQRNTLQFFFLLLVVFFPISFLFIWKNHARFNLNWRSLAHNTISAHTSPNQNMAWMFLVPISTTIHGSTEEKKIRNPKHHRFFYSISFSSTLFFVVLFVGFYYIFSLSLSRELFIFFPFGCLNKSVDFILFYPPVFVCLCVVSLLMHRPFNDTFYAISKYHLNRSQIFNWLQ